MQFNVDLNFFEGDLCRIRGYGNLTWKVIGFTPSVEILHGKEVDKNVIYTFENVFTGEDIIALEEDLILVCKAKYASEYIKQLNDDGSPPNMSKYLGKEKSEVQIYLTQKQKDDMLNELLDRHNDVKRFIEADGEITERNQRQLDEIEAEFNRVSQMPVLHYRNSK